LGIDPDDIAAFNDLGYKNISLDKLVELKTHGVTPSYIERIQQRSDSKDYSLNEYIEMKIHGNTTPLKRQE